MRIKKIILGFCALTVICWLINLQFNPVAMNGRAITHEVFYLTGVLAWGMMTMAILRLEEIELMAAILLWGIAGYFVARMLLSKSFRVLRHWKGAVAVGVVFLALFAVVGFDLTGFETRVPRAQDVASVTIRGLGGTPYDDGFRVDAVLDDPEDNTPERLRQYLAQTGHI